MKEFITTALFIISVFTSLTVQGIKILLDEIGVKYKSNILAIAVSCALSILVMLVYGHHYGYNDIVFNTITLMFFSFLGSTVGYDKVIQTINQIYEDKGDE